MNTTRKFGALSSSIDPTQLSATVSGVILSASAIIILIASQFGFNIDNSSVSAFASQAGIAIGALWFIFGVIRKIIVAIQQKWSTSKQAQQIQ